MDDVIEELSFEDALLELEQTVAQLESGNLSLDFPCRYSSVDSVSPIIAANCWTRPNCVSSN